MPFSKVVLVPIACPDLEYTEYVPILVDETNQHIFIRQAVYVVHPASNLHVVEHGSVPHHAALP